MPRLTCAIALAIMILGITAASVTASPGGLDARGEHHCWTNCGRYGLYYG
jgi:hypothetical protein